MEKQIYIILKTLYAIKDEDVFYFESYGKELIKNLLAESKYRKMNHHHELTNNHKIVDFGTGEFVANKDGIPLLKALNEIGLTTRTHHIENGKHSFVSIIIEGLQLEIKTVNEKDADRTKFNGKKELLIIWDATN